MEGLEVPVMVGEEVPMPYLVPAVVDWVHLAMEKLLRIVQLVREVEEHP
jgi:hypothetical protein